MDYEKVKAKFEAVVTAMQQEVKAYAGEARASQKAVDAKLYNINSLVEFYTMAEELISSQKVVNLEQQVNYDRLHGDTQKLVVFAQLHGANPNLVFHYSLGELKKMQADGLVIRPPVMSFSKIIFAGNEGDAMHPQVELAYPEPDMDQEAKARECDNKYQRLNLAGSQRC